MPNFHNFAVAVNARFNEMQEQADLFVTVSGDDLWTTYLDSFPEGTDPIYIERTTHDCSCCRQFIKNIGNVVALSGLKYMTVWDIDNLEYPYNVVAEALRKKVRSADISNLFATSFNKFGAEQTIQYVDGKTKGWNHFFADVKSKFVTSLPDQVRGDRRTSAEVMLSSLLNLSEEALATVDELIAHGSLYRGEEFSELVRKFRRLHDEFHSETTSREKRRFNWLHSRSSLARFKNTVIGTLVSDLSEGMGLEQAVASFEAKVAPTNYKRPTSLITPAMVEKATKTIAKLGLETALERRFATVSDIGVNNVLWVNNEAKTKMRKSSTIIDLLMAEAKPSKKRNVSGAQISIEQFVDTVLPRASSIELLLENRHLPNFVSLTAPVHEDSSPLFKWSNGLGWSYDGNVTDSIKERVKRAGGNVDDAALRISLAWHNKDDLDIHVKEPNGNEIFFFNKEGKLDVDMNVTNPVRDAVENVSFLDHQLKNGTYKVLVNQYSRRETVDVGFEIEVAASDLVENFVHEKAVSSAILCLHIHVANGRVTDIQVMDKNLKRGSSSKEHWGLVTGSHVPVKIITLSPNHWDENAVGNKHWLFFLEGCHNPQAIRGIYNEFLKSELDIHRKVFEVLGNKTQCEPSADQLSGLGFSSTKDATVALRVSGTDRSRIDYEVKF